MPDRGRCPPGASRHCRAVLGVQTCHTAAAPLTGRHTLLATEARVGGALLAEDLLAQHVCIPAVLRKLTQDVRVHPAQRERAAPIAADDVVQPRDDVARRDASQAPRCARWTEATVLSSTRTKDSIWTGPPRSLGSLPR
jgi:hypothetical protein